MGSVQLYQQTEFMRHFQQEQLKAGNGQTVAMTGITPTSAALATGGNEPIIATPSTYAVLGELGALGVNETFNIRDIERVNKTNNSEKIARTGGIMTQYTNPIGVRAVDPSLSYVRGEYGVNIPLNGDALYTNGGYLGANLNLIC